MPANSVLKATSRFELLEGSERIIEEFSRLLIVDRDTLFVGTPVVLYVIAETSGTTADGNPIIEHVKVGISDSAERRLASLAGGNPRDLWLLASIFPVTRRVETLVARILSDDHVRGEWYRFSPDVERFTAWLGDVGDDLRLAGARDLDSARNVLLDIARDDA